MRPAPAPARAVAYGDLKSAIRQGLDMAIVVGIRASMDGRLVGSYRRRVSSS